MLFKENKSSHKNLLFSGHPWLERNIRQYFCEDQAHNTVTVNRVSYRKMWNDFLQQDEITCHAIRETFKLPQTIFPGYDISQRGISIGQRGIAPQPSLDFCLSLNQTIN